MSRPVGVVVSIASCRLFIDAALGEVVDGGHEMREGAPEAVEAPHDEGVALVELGQGPVEAGASSQDA